MNDLKDMAFWTLIVPPGKQGVCEIEQSLERVQFVHVTNAAVALGAKPGPHTLTVMVGETEITVATLDNKNNPQHPLDFVLDQTTVFKNHGPSAVHLLGYHTTADVRDMREGDGLESDDMDFEEVDEEDELGEEEEDDEDDEAPDGVHLRLANGKAKKVAASKGRAVSDDLENYEDGGEGEDEGDEEDEIEEDEEDEEGVDAAQGDVFNEDKDEEGEEGEEEEPASPPTKAPGKRVLLSAPTTPAAAQAKKAKGPDGKPTPAVTTMQPPASAPPKQQQKKPKGLLAAGAALAAAATTAEKPKDEKGFIAALVNILQAKPNKTCTLAQLGSSVHRPPGVPKLGQLIKSKASLFKLDTTGQNVTLL